MHPALAFGGGRRYPSSMNPAVHHEPTGETYESKLRWFAGLTFSERFDHLCDTLAFLSDAGVRKSTRDEEPHDATDSFRVVRRPRPA